MFAAFVQLACAFRYGSEDLDVMGLCFRKDIWFEQVQIYPECNKPQLSAMHETLLKKAGDNAYAFSFEVWEDFKTSAGSAFYASVHGAEPLCWNCWEKSIFIDVK